MVFKYIIPLFVLANIALADYSPVLLWGGNQVPKPALSTVSSDEFSQILSSSLDNSMILAFVESNVLPENFLLCKKSEEGTCFSNLKNVAQKTYYTNVQTPASVIQEASENVQFVRIQSNGQANNPITYETGKVVVVSFDAVEDIADGDDITELHDATISKLYNELSNKGKVVGVYTTQSPSLKRRARDIVQTTGGTILRDSNIISVYFTNFSIFDKDELQHTATFTGIKISDKTDGNFSVELTGDAKAQVSFNVQLNQGYFVVSNIFANGVKYLINPVIEAPTNFSYFCGNATLNAAPTKETVPTSYIQWNSLQLQAPFNPQASNTFAFGDPWHCVPFVSASILSGLFVSVILIAIMGVGICWMMDIKTMDRFDDPKGKTITINASE